MKMTNPLSSRPGIEPAYAAQMKALFRRHPNTTFIWAHIGVGRIIRPIKDQAAIVEEIINDPQLREASEKVRKKNYERIFDGARRKVRSWEAAHVK